MSDRVGEIRTVTISQTYDAAVDDVWDACTNPERIPRWFLPVTGELRLGGTTNSKGNAGGTIEECDPPTRFRATWEFGGSVSWIEVRLVADTDERTRLELAHTAPVDDHWSEFGPGRGRSRLGLGLVGLCLHLAVGSRRGPGPLRRVDPLARRHAVHDHEQRGLARRGHRRGHAADRGERDRVAHHRRLHAGPWSLIARG